MTIHLKIKGNLNLKSEIAMERNDKNSPAPHAPNDRNPYSYPLQQPNRKGWLKALLALIAVAVVVTLVCLVVGIYNHHEESLPSAPAPAETVILNP